MHKTKMEHEHIEKLLGDFSSWAVDEASRGKECVDTHEMGAVVDMIKDLADAKEKLWKACYYKEIVEAMDDYSEEEEDKELIERIIHKMARGEELDEHERMGYDRWRYSSGRFAPTGRGHYTRRRGFTPWPTVDPMMGRDWDDMGTYGDRLGYPIGDMPKYGPERPYDMYKRSKMHYTKTGSPSDKTEMNEHAAHHMKESIDTFREIWEDADPELKRKMKGDLTSLMNEMM